MTTQLTRGAIKSLETKTSSLPPNEKMNIQTDYIFQIEKATKQSSNNVFTCTLFDHDSKYAGFFITSYEDPQGGTPEVGDIIQVCKIIGVRNKTKAGFYYMCRNIKLLKKAAPFIIDPENLNNISKKKISENYKNTVYKNDEKLLDDIVNNQNNVNNFDNKYDDTKCTLISGLTTFQSNNCVIYVKCKMKTEIKNLISKNNKKDFTLQNYFFMDTKGDEIQATAFGKNAERFDQIIEKDKVYEIKKFPIQLADKKYNQTNCDYKILFNEQTSIITLKDNSKFGNIIYNFIEISQIKEMLIGKLVDVLGFVLEDKGYQIFNTKNGGSTENRRILIGDISLHKIEITMWPPKANKDKNYEIGEIFAAKNLRISEFAGKKKLNTIDATEFITNLKNNEKSNLKKFFNEHENINEYQDVEGDTLNTNSFNIPDLLFIDKIIESYDIDMDNKDRPFIEVDAYAIQMTHSERNFYKGCAKCKKKMETEVCMHCSSEESKLLIFGF